MAGDGGKGPRGATVLVGNTIDQALTLLRQSILIEWLLEDGMCQANPVAGLLDLMLVTVRMRRVYVLHWKAGSCKDMNFSRRWREKPSARQYEFWPGSQSTIRYQRVLTLSIRNSQKNEKSTNNCSRAHSLEFSLDEPAAYSL